MSSILYVCYLNYSPLFEEKLTGKLETVNELLFLILCYIMVLFSNIVPQYSTRELIGWYFIYTSITIVAINILIILWLGLVKLQAKLRLCLLKRK